MRVSLSRRAPCVYVIRKRGRTGVGCCVLPGVRHAPRQVHAPRPRAACERAAAGLRSVRRSPHDRGGGRAVPSARPRERWQVWSEDRAGRRAQHWHQRGTAAARQCRSLEAPLRSAAAPVAGRPSRAALQTQPGRRHLPEQCRRAGCRAGLVQPCDGDVSSSAFARCVSESGAIMIRMEVAAALLGLRRVRVRGRLPRLRSMKSALRSGMPATMVAAR